VTSTENAESVTGVVPQRAQGMLFDDDLPDLDTSTGYRGPTACRAAGITGLLDAIISVEQAGTFKPAPEVYGLIWSTLGVTPARTLFVSGNPWDTQAALANGFVVARVNRHGDPDEYDLHRHLLAELRDLSELPAILRPSPT